MMQSIKWQLKNILWENGNGDVEVVKITSKEIESYTEQQKNNRFGAVWQDWDSVQNECQHVVDSLCLISSANKVHFRENQVVHFA